jgi:transcriptional regulator with XRE-family HTH domain
VNTDVGLGDKIREAREKAGLTQDDLAYRLRVYPTLERVTSSLISGWENDEVKRVSFNAVAGISKVTGTPLDFFSELSDDPPRDAASSDPGPGLEDGGVAAGVMEAVEQRSRGRGVRSPKRSRG